MANQDNDLSNLFFQPVNNNDTDTDENAKLNDSADEDSSNDNQNVDEPELLSDTNTQTESEIDNSINESSSDIPDDNTDGIIENETVNKSIKNTKEKTKDTKKKHSLVGPIIGAIAILAIIAAIILFEFMSNDKSDKSSSNNQYTSKLFDFTSPIDEALGRKEIADLILTNSFELNSSFTINNINNDPDLTGITFNMDCAKDIVNKKASTDMAFTYRNANLISANMYIDPSDIKVKVPSLSDTVFTAKSDNLSQQIVDSPLFKSEDASSADVFKSIFNLYSIEDFYTAQDPKDYQLNLLDRVINQLADTYPDDFDEIKSGITSTQLGTDQNGNIGKRITISASTVELIFSKLLTLPVDSEMYSEYLKSTMASAAIANSNNPDEYVDELISEYKEEVKNLVAQFSLVYDTDIVMDVYQNTDGKLVSLTSKNEIDIAGTPINVNLFVKSSDNENPANDMEISLVVTVEDETLDITFSNSNTSDNGVLKNVKNLTVTVPSSDPFKFVCLEKYNTKNGNYSLTANATCGQELSAELNAVGTVTDLQLGTSLSMSFDTIEFKSDGNTVFSCKGLLGINKLSKSVVAPTGTECKIFEVSEDELAPIADEMKKNLESISSLLGQ